MGDLRVAIFDLDGTLVSSENVIYMLLNEALGELNKEPLDFMKVRSFIGMNLKEILALFFPNEDEVFYQKCHDLFHDKYQEITASEGHIICYPHIKEQLKKLNEAGWIMGVCTGAGRKSCERHLKDNSIDQYFVTLKTASDNYPSKPDPHILQAAIAECGGRIEDAIMVGDTIYDIGMAHKINVKSIGVLWGYHEKERLVSAGAQRIIDNPIFLFETLEELINEHR